MVKKEANLKEKKTLKNKLSISIGLIIIILIAGAFVYFYWQPAKPLMEGQSSILEGKVNVGIRGFSFNPEEVKISRGEIVVWTNYDSTPHSIKSDSGDVLSSPPLLRGESYSYQFNETGTYSYYCEPHRYMKARIIVE